MKTPTKCLSAVGLATVLALGAATSSLAQRYYECIQEYDSSGAPTPPYCD
jgi:hypothetical protein